MSDKLSYRTDLYQGTAESYDRFRPPYPTAVLDHLRTRLPVTGAGRLLDLACGTGQIAFALADDFSAVVAIDQEPELVQFASRKASTLGVDNVDWLVGAAEDVAINGSFELIAVGNAFHRLDREAVARRLLPKLDRNGALALLWSDSPWSGERQWQRQLASSLDRWRGALGADRVPARWRQAMQGDPHADVLSRAGFRYDERVDFAVTWSWSIDTLIGFVYSTSFLNRRVLGRKVADFEKQVRVQLSDLGDGGSYLQDLTFACEIARPPG